MTHLFADDLADVLATELDFRPACDDDRLIYRPRDAEAFVGITVGSRGDIAVYLTEHCTITLGDQTSRLKGEPYVVAQVTGALPGRFGAECAAADDRLGGALRAALMLGNEAAVAFAYRMDFYAMVLGNPGGVHEPIAAD